MDLNIKNIDITKADLGLRHEYIPDTPFNLAEKDESKRIIVDCEYFAAGERMKYSSMDADESGKNVSMDFRKAFKNKVKGIRNLTINGKAVTTAEELLKYPSVLELDALVINVVSHIMKSDELTEDETKN